MNESDSSKINGEQQTDTIKEKISFKEWMEESKPVSRFKLLRWALIGMFCGVCMTTIFMLYASTM